MVTAAVRSIFAQPDAEHVRDQLDVTASMPGKQFPKVEEMPREAAGDITAYPLEWVSREVRRRTNVGVSSNPEALHRLADCILIEIHDEWQITERRHLSAGSGPDQAEASLRCLD
jgi:putative transposase